MKTSRLPVGPSAYDSDGEAEKILKEYDPYIVALARKKVPRNAVHPEMLADEIDELAQRVRFKLWLMLRRKRIVNLKLYIRCIVLTEVVEMVRRYKLTFPLPLDEDGELYQGNMLILLGEGMQDPAYEVEQAEALEVCTQDIVEAVLNLPPQQQRAMICSLQDEIDEVFPVLHLLQWHVTNIEEQHWPESKEGLQSMRASLSVARKKLRRSLEGKHLS